MVPRLLSPDDIMSVVGKVVVAAKVEANDDAEAVEAIVSAGLKELLKEDWLRRLKEEFMGLNPGGVGVTEVTGSDDEIDEDLVASTEVLTLAADDDDIDDVGRAEILPISDEMAEVGGGIPSGIAEMGMLGMLGGGTAAGVIAGINEPRVGIGTGSGGMVGMVGIVGIIKNMEVGGLGPTASMFNSPDSSFM